MKIGDLIKRVNPWTKHNSWMKFEQSLGLVVDVTMYHSRFSYKVIWTNEEVNIDPHYYVDEDDVRLYEGG